MFVHIVDLLRRDFIDYQKMDVPFEFTKSRGMLACGRGLRAHVPKASQLLIFTCQRCVPIFQFGVPFNFSTSPAKARANFLTIFQNNFSILNFPIILIIWKFQ